jgi:hypothetical protein
MFTLENVFKKREEFELACKEAGACIEEYTKLINSKTKKEFMEVIYNNMYWINDNIDKFEPKFDVVYSFSEGFARVRLDDKWGFIDTKGNYLVEPKFNFIDEFSAGFAHVNLDDKWGIIDKKGNCLFETKFD